VALVTKLAGLEAKVAGKSSAVARAGVARSGLEDLEERLRQRKEEEQRLAEKRKTFETGHGPSKFKARITGHLHERTEEYVERHEEAIRAVEAAKKLVEKAKEEAEEADKQVALVKVEEQKLADARLEFIQLVEQMFTAHPHFFPEEDERADEVTFKFNALTKASAELPPLTTAHAHLQKATGYMEQAIQALQASSTANVVGLIGGRGMLDVMATMAEQANLARAQGLAMEASKEVLTAKTTFPGIPGLGAINITGGPMQTFMGLMFRGAVMDLLIRQQIMQSLAYTQSQLQSLHAVLSWTSAHLSQMRAGADAARAGYDESRTRLQECRKEIAARFAKEKGLDVHVLREAYLLPPVIQAKGKVTSVQPVAAAAQVIVVNTGGDMMGNMGGNYVW